MTVSSRIRDRLLADWVYVAQSRVHGRGLFARVAIPAGTYIGTYWGPWAKRNGPYVLWLCDPDGIDPPRGRRGCNMLRYLNHGHPPNAEFWDFDLYARIDIAAGVELLIDYGEQHP